MSSRSLQQALQETDNVVKRFRKESGIVAFPNLASEYTNWINEQRAWRETCCLADLTHHQMDQVIEGPDAIELFSKLCVNSFEDFEVGDAKQAVMCNPDGKLIGDGILQYIDNEKFVLSGSPSPANWLAYHAETGDYDVDQKIYPMSVMTDDDPHYYTYQVQGPNALDVMEDVTDEPLPDIPFFKWDTLSINGHEVRALRHGMAGEVGFEMQGPFEHGEEIKNALMDAGENHGIRHLGTRAYKSTPVIVGWVDVYAKALYEHPELEDYREWLPVDGFEGTLSIFGSFNSDDITDYYLSPVEAGLKNVINFDHDFIGREALEEEVANPDRTLVTLVWNSLDASDIYDSLFQEGETLKFADLPRARMRAHYDRVLNKDGDLIGLSRHPAYTYNERQMLSLCTVDVEYAEPGTEVALVWGEEGDQSSPAIEPHRQTKIRATVQPAPYVTDRRKSDW
ncbi:aminomethyltransferase family protein [Halobellus rufus]|uniref:aminomethyltransferase family protein n=1 Tax=Halobellus rufus TaxID=1448860 RepID=UPI000678D4B6|nr:aminomethyltransferase family protein [Halobellus rufus]